MTHHPPSAAKRFTLLGTQLRTPRPIEPSFRAITAVPTAAPRQPSLTRYRKSASFPQQKESLHASPPPPPSSPFPTDPKQAFAHRHISAETIFRIRCMITSIQRVSKASTKKRITSAEQAFDLIMTVCHPIRPWNVAGTHIHMHNTHTAPAARQQQQLHISNQVLDSNTLRRPSLDPLCRLSHCKLRFVLPPLPENKKKKIRSDKSVSAPRHGPYLFPRSLRRLSQLLNALMLFLTSTPPPPPYPPVHLLAN